MKVRGLIAAAVAAAILVVAAPAGAATFTTQQRSALYRDRAGHVAVLRRRRRSGHAPPARQPRVPGTQSCAATYTSAANVGVYLWAVVAAHDLGLISTRAGRSARAVDPERGRDAQALRRLHVPVVRHEQRRRAVEPRTRGLHRDDAGGDGQLLVHLGGRQRLVRVGADRGSAGVTRRARPGRRHCWRRWTSASSTTTARRPTATSTPRCPDNPPTGQMYGGFYVDQGPAGYHNSALYSDPRIAMYIGMGRHQMPGDVWWRSWRTPPPQRCSTDPVNTNAGTGYWQTYTDPQSGKPFEVWEGHYSYPGTSLSFVPTFAGGMFEGLMANLVVPETTLGTAQLRARRPALGAGPGEVRDAGARLPGVGHVAVQHRRRHRGLRRVRRRRPGVRLR